MSEKRTLRIHAHITPETAADNSKPKNSKRPRKISRERLSETAPRRIICSKNKLSFGDRMLRNSSIACAALLGILALGNIDRPWAQKASESIEQALNMRIDLDDSIGELSFVKNIMPESALVFLNVSGKAEFTMPVSGEISHPWSNIQPWTMFSCPDNMPVYAAQSGIITAVSPLSEGKTGILIDHGMGTETIYAYMDSSEVESGDKVEKGQRIGMASGNLYFEWRVNGTSEDPAEKLGI